MFVAIMLHMQSADHLSFTPVNVCVICAQVCLLISIVNPCMSIHHFHAETHH